MPAHALSSSSPDPLVPVDEGVMPTSEYASHVRTFNAVLSAARWFIIHVALLLVALYAFAIAGNPGAGGLLIVCSLGLLIYGMMQRGSVRNDIVKGLGAGPRAPEAKIRDNDVGEGDATA